MFFSFDINHSYHVYWTDTQTDTQTNWHAGIIYSWCVIATIILIFFSKLPGLL